MHRLPHMCSSMRYGRAPSYVTRGAARREGAAALRHRMKAPLYQTSLRAAQRVACRAAHMARFNTKTRARAFLATSWQTAEGGKWRQWRKR